MVEEQGAFVVLTAENHEQGGAGVCLSCLLTHCGPASSH
jgi:hypothetical protein